MSNTPNAMNTETENTMVEFRKSEKDEALVHAILHKAMNHNLAEAYPCDLRKYAAALDRLADAMDSLAKAKRAAADCR